MFKKPDSGTELRKREEEEKQETDLNLVPKISGASSTVRFFLCFRLLRNRRQKNGFFFRQPFSKASSWEGPALAAAKLRF